MYKIILVNLQVKEIYAKNIVEFKFMTFFKIFYFIYGS